MIHTKLDLLKETLIISRDVYSYAQGVIEHLLAHQHIKQADEAATLIIHLAMACMRSIDKEEPVAKLDSAQLLELSLEPQYDKAKALWLAIAPKECAVLHPHEEDYLYMHLLTLLNK